MSLVLMSDITKPLMMEGKEIKDRMRILMETCWRLNNEIDELKNKISRLEQEYFGNEYDKQIDAYHQTQLDFSPDPFDIDPDYDSDWDTAEDWGS